jgi:hypothetical protein
MSAGRGQLWGVNAMDGPKIIQLALLFNVRSWPKTANPDKSPA